MYQLIAVLGATAGKRYPLQEGKNRIGRQTDGNEIVLDSYQVSKKHCVIELVGSDCQMSDLGSANGTWVNGDLIQKKRLFPNDQIRIGDHVFLLKEIKPEPSPSSWPAVSPTLTPLPAATDPLVGLSQPAVSQEFSSETPKDLLGKLIYYFEKYLMRFFYHLNLSYEWNLVCLFIFSGFVLANLYFSAAPVIDLSQGFLVKEAKLRASLLAKQLAYQNTAALSAHNLGQTDLGIVGNSDGVLLAVIIDLENRILVPGNQVNDYLTSGFESVLALKAKEKFLSGLETGWVVQSGELSVVAVEPLVSFNKQLNKNTVFAMAIVTLDLNLSSLGIGEMGLLYSQVLIATGFIALMSLLILYRLTTNPLRTLNAALDRVLKNEVQQITLEYKMEELGPVLDAINTLIQRSSASGMGSGGGASSVGGMTEEEFMGLKAAFEMLGQLNPGGLLVLSGDKKVFYLNTVFEDLSGIRSELALGQEVTQVVRDQGFGAFLEDFLSKLAPGTSFLTEDLEFSGVMYQVNGSALGKAGDLPKGFILFFLKKDS